MGERAIEAMVERGLQRTAFKRRIAEHGGFQQQLARARIRLDAARLTVLDAAHTLDLVGNKKVWWSSQEPSWPNSIPGQAHACTLLPIRLPAHL